MGKGILIKYTIIPTYLKGEKTDFKNELNPK
jgi:hypothetical protein